MRKCDITNEYFSEGFCIGDGLMYIKYESDMLKQVKKVGYKSLQEAYDDEYYYWTEWEEDDVLDEE